LELLVLVLVLVLVELELVLVLVLELVSCIRRIVGRHCFYTSNPVHHLLSTQL
jgi:hypothetical protein